MPAEKRPNPDDILSALEAEQKSAHRGHLKIFFGASAGVGKTYAMLKAAQVLHREGQDVLVGIVETHKRPETEDLLSGLTILPRKRILHKGVEIFEFDLDAALARAPEIILVDELAHTNAPGSRHLKRWQDVEELLQAGINVYATLNVQHLESFNDIVGNITGVDVNETIPDAFFDEADEIQLVDIPTEDLLSRLNEGKVYVAEGAATRAAQNFFNKTNLMSLRELALRRTAEHVDADTDYERIHAGLFTPNTAGDRVLVCVGPDRLAAKLMRSGRRMARSLKAPWYVLSIDSGDIDPEDRGQKHLRRALQIAEQNDAQVTVLEQNRIGDAILEYARSKGITKIVVGRNIRSPWIDWTFGSLVEYIIRHAVNIDVYVITGNADKKKRFNAWIPQPDPLKNYALSFSLAAACTALGMLVDPFLEPIDIVMIYLMGALFAAMRLGRYPSLAFSFLSVLSFNFFFIDPIYTFSFSSNSYWLTFPVMFATSVVISSQASKLRSQTLHSRRRERETQTFFALTREMAATRGQQAILNLTYRHLHEALEGLSSLWMRLEDGRFDILGEHSPTERIREETVAAWACENKQPAGMGTDTLPSASAYYQPVIGTAQSYGVIAYRPFKGKNELTAHEKVSLETFANLLASSLDRVNAASLAEEMRVEREAEALKNTFLSSMSHDLRTPLAAIRGSAEALLQDQTMAEHTKKELLRSIHSQSDRLTRVMNNLLDLARLETGKISINTESYYLQEIIGAATGRLQNLLQDHHIVTDIPADLPMVIVDGLLIEQVLQNLLENAVGFSPKKSTITISAKIHSKGLVLSIADQGPGIPSGLEQRVFEKFYTTERADRSKGAGLGLAICQAIITAHDGRLWASKITETDSGTGAVFHIFLPASRMVLNLPIEEPVV